MRSLNVSPGRQRLSELRDAVLRHAIRKLSQYTGQDGQKLGDLSWACI